MKTVLGLGLVGLLLAGAGLVFAMRGLRGGGEAGNAYVTSVVDEDPVASDAVSTDDAATGKPQHPRHRAAAPNSPAGEAWLTRFELIERSGRTVRSEDLKGQPYVVGFFFTLCPSICLNQNAKVKELQDKFRGEAVRLLSISCDPEVDRPEVLREYAERFDADEEQWLFLTGEMDYISRVAAEMYFLAAHRRFHAEKFVLVDAQGNNVGFYNWSDPLQFNQLIRDIEKLLAGEPVERAAGLPAPPT